MEIKAIISKKISKRVWILLACWLVIYALFTTLCFVFGKEIETRSPYTFTYCDNYCWLGIKYAYERTKITYDPLTGTVTLITCGFNEGMTILVIFLNIFIFTIVPLIFILINKRKRKLTELTANEKEIVGSYTRFIPVSKINLKMPIEKIDNISAVKNCFFLYTGKALRIGSTSNVIKIPYVLNTDEMVAFISEAIEKAKIDPIDTAETQESH